MLELTNQFNDNLRRVEKTNIKDYSKLESAKDNTRFKNQNNDILFNIMDLENKQNKKLLFFSIININPFNSFTTKKN